MIYLDSAATSYHRPKEVAQAVYDAILIMGNAGRGSHASSLSSARMIYETRRLLCELFGGPAPEQVVFTCNATEALNIAIQGLAKPGIRLAATAMDHNSVLRPLYLAEQKGSTIEIIGADEKGGISLESVERLFQKGLDVFVCTHASNVTGNVNPIREIGTLCKKYGVLFVVDASQTAGILPIDMQKDQIDILCFTGHKGLMGPQGTGGMIVREQVQLPAFKVGGSGVQSFLKTHPSQMPTALEAGTLNGHGIAGLHAALQYILEQGVDTIHRIECERMQQFYEGVTEIESVHVYGDFSKMQNRAPIVSLNMGDYDSAAVSDELSEVYGIQTRSGAHCAPLMHQTFHTEEQGMVRFSFSHFVTEEQIKETIWALQEMAGGSV